MTGIPVPQSPKPKVCWISRATTSEEYCLGRDCAIFDEGMSCCAIKSIAIRPQAYIDTSGAANMIAGALNNMALRHNNGY